MNATWTYGGKTVVIEAGVVVASDSAAFAVGGKADARRLKLMGWKKAAKATQYDAFGRSFRADGDINRE